MRLCGYRSCLFALAALAWPAPASSASEVSPGVQIVKGAAIAEKIDRAAQWTDVSAI